MTIIIEKGMTRKQIDSALKKLSEKKQTKMLDHNKYFGKLNWKGDVIETQRRLRDDSNYNY